MPWIRPTLTGLQAQARSDITTANLPTLSGQILPKSVLGVLADSIAGLSFLHFGFIDYCAKQSVPWSADGEFLSAWAALRGVLRNPDTAATGAVQFTGVESSVMPAGTVVQRSDGWHYALNADLTITGGTGTAPITAVETGAAGNADVGTTLTLTTNIIGITRPGTASQPIVGGTDIETDDSLRTRMLLAYSSTPTGGSSADYVIWARQVAGVTRAWAMSPGGGYVTVWTMWDVVNVEYDGFPQGTNGASQYEPRYAPATGQQLLVADHIFGLRPVTALVISAAPQAQPVNLTIADLDPPTQAMRDQITTAVETQFVRIGNPLGMIVYQSQISEAILAVPGLNRFDLTMPDEVAIAVGYLPTLGTITYTE